MADSAALIAFKTALHSQFSAEKEQEAKKAEEKAKLAPSPENEEDAKKKREIADEVAKNNQEVNRANDAMQDRVKQDSTHGEPNNSSKAASESAKQGAQSSPASEQASAPPEQTKLPNDVRSLDEMGKLGEQANSGVQKDTTPPSTVSPELNKPSDPNMPQEVATKAPDSAMPEQNASPSSVPDSLPRTEPSSPPTADTTAKPATGYAKPMAEEPSLLNDATREVYAAKRLSDYENKFGNASAEKAERIKNAARADYDDAVFAIGHDAESSMLGASKTTIAQSLIMNPPGTPTSQVSSVGGGRVPSRVRPGIRGRPN